MKIKIFINDRELDLSEVDMTNSPEEIMDDVVDALGMEVDPEFNGLYRTIRQPH